MKRMMLALAFTLSVLASLCGTAYGATTTKPVSVMDYYMLLPQEYFEVPLASRKNLIDASGGGFVDKANGFLFAQGDGAQPSLDVALFKRKDGSYVVAVHSDTTDEIDGFLDFYEWNGKKLVRVPNLLPKPFDSKFTYKIPRRGTTIAVASVKGSKRFSYKWNGTKFVAAP
jgi:hypothetical protein